MCEAHLRTEINGYAQGSGLRLATKASPRPGVRACRQGAGLSARLGSGLAFGPNSPAEAQKGDGNMRGIAFDIRLKMRRQSQTPINKWMLYSSITRLE